MANSCEPGGDPCPDQMCDEDADNCIDCRVDVDCDDDQFCNGSESCVAGQCEGGINFCPQEECDEVNDRCLLGACCFNDGFCVEAVDGGDCTLVGGAYLGDGLSCDDGDPDGDGAFWCEDGCPLDPNKVEPEVCGCGVPDVDSDVDGVFDCVDTCPDSSSEVPANECGCIALGACCVAVDVCWDDVEGGDCTAIGGIYQGDGATCGEACGFGDFDGNGGVDLRDYAAFQCCFTGPFGGPVGSECRNGDIDGCGAIDLSDLEAFGRAFTGP